MSDDLPAARFFGMYLQAVDQRDGERKQFLVLPPVYLGTHKASGRITWWERNQFTNAQRPKWTFNFEGRTTYSTFQSRVESYIKHDTWIVSEPVVVRVTEAEVKQWITDQKTPYDLINRLEKRARLRNIVIQGPTSIPQVVTAPPSS